MYEGNTLLPVIQASSRMTKFIEIKFKKRGTVKKGYSDPKPVLFKRKHVNQAQYYVNYN